MRSCNNPLTRCAPFSLYQLSPSAPLPREHHIREDDTLCCWRQSDRDRFTVCAATSRPTELPYAHTLPYRVCTRRRAPAAACLRLAQPLPAALGRFACCGHADPSYRVPSSYHAASSYRVALICDGCRACPHAPPSRREAVCRARCPSHQSPRAARLPRRTPWPLGARRASPADHQPSWP